VISTRLSLLVAFSAVLGLQACSLLPGSGPSGGAFWDSGAYVSETGEPPFALVEVDDATLDALARRPAPSLRGAFGDYRPPATQPIGVGDALQITIWEAASGGLFSSPTSDRLSPGPRSAVIPEQVVGRDGAITVPYAGRVVVAGKTQPQVEATIIERLRGKAIEPQALVNVSRNVSNTVTVTGDVANGARVPLTLHGDRVLDVVAAAGGYRSPTHETFVNLTRGGRTARAPIQVLIDNPAENIFVRPGDIVIVEHTPRTFTVAGAVGTNGVAHFDARGMTLDEAVGKAGGLQDQRADPENVYVLRYEPDRFARELPTVSPGLLSRPYVPVAYHLNFRDPRALFAARRFAVREKDILYVSNAPLVEVSKVFQLFGLVSSPASQGLAAAAYSGAKL
jgi:polysaccharide biosynthesis/export protein